MTLHAQFRRLLREPLVHFLIAGFAVFAFSAWRGEPVDLASRAIEIDEAQVSRLAERFVQSRQRTPSPDELDALIRDHIKEEVYYREALRLGLEADDAIIRQRLRSKMEYLARAQAENAVADDAVLQRWLDTNAARYASETSYSFDQIYMGDETSAAVFSYVKSQLVKGGRWQISGSKTSLPPTVENQDAKQIAREFGEGFTAALALLIAGDNWVGPISSGFGQHLVRLRSVSPGRKPALSEVRQQVENDWRAETAKAREAAAYQALLDGYAIRIAKP